MSGFSSPYAPFFLSSVDRFAHTHKEPTERENIIIRHTKEWKHNHQRMGCPVACEEKRDLFSFFPTRLFFRFLRGFCFLTSVFLTVSHKNTMTEDRIFSRDSINACNMRESFLQLTKKGWRKNTNERERGTVFGLFFSFILPHICLQCIHPPLILHNSPEGIRRFLCFSLFLEKREKRFLSPPAKIAERESLLHTKHNKRQSNFGHKDAFPAPKKGRWEREREIIVPTFGCMQFSETWPPKQRRLQLGDSSFCCCFCTHI